MGRRKGKKWSKAEREQRRQAKVLRLNAVAFKTDQRRSKLTRHAWMIAEDRGDAVGGTV